MRFVVAGVAVLVCSSIWAQTKIDVTQVALSTSAPNAHGRPLAVFELVSGAVEPAADCECYVWPDCWCTTLTTSIDATGYSKVGAFVRTDDAGGAVFELLWRWSDDEPFRRVQNAVSGAPFRGNSGEPYVYPGIGGTVALHVEWYTETIIKSARVYLIP
jgi:hypothetical protein